MRTLKNLPQLATVTLLAIAIAGCSRETPPAPSDPAPAAAPAPDPAPPADSATPAAPAPDTTPGPEAMPPDAAPPADTTPSPIDPAPAAKPTSAHVPALESMKLAAASGKLGVAADVRYSFDAPATAGQPVTLNIAVVPRVAGQTLEFSLERAEGVQVAAGPVSLLKVGQADTLRQQFSITRTAGTARTLKVLVTHQWNDGSAFGFYSIPFD